ncbi:hypothetical protein KY340_00080, partial [Candidatus Woesearchaeota archaeon]|nr:hypothetical protein [Candidatus Woesearchaeota archaeon]
MASKKITAYIEKNAHLGYPIAQIRAELLREGYDKHEIEEAINVCYKQSSHFSVLRFPLLFLVIGMPVVLLLLLTVAKNLFLSDTWYFVIFASYPAAIAIYLGYKCAIENIPEAQSLKYELLIGVISGVIGILFTALFLKPMPFELYYLAVIILVISCFSAIFVTLLTRYILREHITPGVVKPLLNYKSKFNLEKFFLLNGDVRMALFIASLLFIGFFFGSILKSVIFIVLLVAAFTLIGHCYESRNEVLAVATMLALFGFLGIYCWPFFVLLGIALLRALVYYIKTEKRHNFFALFSVYLVAFTYLVALLCITFLFFAYIIAPLLRPISIFYLALIFFIFAAIIVCPIFMLLLYSLLEKTTGKIAYISALWPITIIVRPHRHKFSDAIRTGFSIGAIWLIIVLVAVSVFGGILVNDSYDTMFKQRAEYDKMSEIDLQNLLLNPKFNYRLPSDYPVPDLLLQLKQRHQLQKQKLMTFPVERPETFFQSLRLFIGGKVFDDKLKFLEQIIKTEMELRNSKELLDIGVRDLLMQYANEKDKVQFEEGTANVQDHIEEMRFRSEQMLIKIQPGLGMKSPEQTLTPGAIKQLVLSGKSPLAKTWEKLIDQTEFGRLFGQSFLISQNAKDSYSNANLIREFQSMKTKTISEESIRLRILLYIVGREYARQCLPDDSECFNLLPHFVTDIETCRDIKTPYCSAAFSAVLPDYYARCAEDKFVQ